MVIVVKCYYEVIENGWIECFDFGQVGDVIKVDIWFLKMLFLNNFVFVVICIVFDEVRQDYNVNVDMFVGVLVGVLKVQDYLVLMDVDGLLRDIDDLFLFIQWLMFEELFGFYGSVIKGGMIFKLEFC